MKSLVISTIRTMDIVGIVGRSWLGKIMVDLVNEALGKFRMDYSETIRVAMFKSGVYTVTQKIPILPTAKLVLFEDYHKTAKPRRRSRKKR